MNPKELEEKYQENKDKFHKYIDNIKLKMKVDIYSIINTTLIINPYSTKFPLNFFLKKYTNTNKLFLFVKSICKFYIKQFYLLLSYVVSFFLYKIYYNHKVLNENSYIGIDLFLLVDNIIKDDMFNENYFKTIYPILDKKYKNYIFIPRLYRIGKNPFKLVKLFKILNQDNRKFLFEFELLSFRDFISIFMMILIYPFKTLRLLQEENTLEDKLFNIELINDISSMGFDAFVRYVYGSNISKINNINIIYSWSEFQVVERSFNYGVRNNNNIIKLIACQFYLNYEIYFNSVVHDVDFYNLSAPHKILVNGSKYMKDREKVKYEVGVSLRYKNTFDFMGIESENNILLLGSYIEKDTKYMLESVASLRNVIFKNHPAVSIDKFTNISSNIVISNANIYELFKHTSVAIGTASGSSVEAVACGISVIIIASKDNLTVNPLVAYGKGKVWDIAFNKDDVERVYNNLIKYRNNNTEETKKIASWYKDNFFIEPTEKNIINNLGIL